MYHLPRGAQPEGLVLMGTKPILVMGIRPMKTLARGQGPGLKASWRVALGGLAPGRPGKCEGLASK